VRWQPWLTSASFKFLFHTFFLTIMADHKSSKQGESHQGGPNVAKQAAGTGEDNDVQRDEQTEKRLQQDALDAPVTHPNR
jgi:hypothetical protein